MTQAFVDAFRLSGANVVLAEFGPTGVAVREACKQANLPLVVHFHGYDASTHSVVKKYDRPYRRLFDQAAAIISVSNAMTNRLSRLGCPTSKLVYSPYGVDCDRFRGAALSGDSPVFLSVGRMVEKKAPHLTILAFSQALSKVPTSSLRMVGEGKLLGPCQDLAIALGVDHRVKFLGALDHTEVAREMQSATAFVQHSVTAGNGDSEGTPVAVLEAGAAGLPVISTRHAGISDVVVEGETGLLVDERDAQSMARHMVAIADNPGWARELGSRAASRIRLYYTVEKCIDRLRSVLNAVVSGESVEKVRNDIFAELPMHHELVEAV